MEAMLYLKYSFNHVNCFLSPPFHLYIVGVSVGKAGLAPRLLQTQLVLFANIIQEEACQRVGKSIWVYKSEGCGHWKNIPVTHCSSSYCCIMKLTQGWVAQINHSIIHTESVGQEFRQETAEMACLWYTVFRASLEKLRGWGWLAGWEPESCGDLFTCITAPQREDLCGCLAHLQVYMVSPCDLGSSQHGGFQGSWNFCMAT